VAAECNIQVDLRVKSAVEAERVVPEIMNLKPVLEGAKLEVTGGMNRPPMERTPKIVEMYQKAKSLAAELGFDLPETGTGGGSDGNFTAALGVPTLDGLGSVGEGGHGPVEFVIAEHMPQRAALLTRLFETI
jgi:glutamate carboxypeptidase